MRSIFLLFCLTGIGQAFQPAFWCTNASGIPKTIRAGGLAELVSDFVYTCTGGQAGSQAYNNIQIFLSTNVTSRVLDPATGATEVFLLIDDPATPVLGQSLFQGYLAAANSISFPNVPLSASGAATRTLRITNVRANATYTPDPNWLYPPQLLGFLSITGASQVAVNNPQVSLANLVPGLMFGLRNSTNVPIASLTFPQAGGLNNALATSPTATGGALTHALLFTEGYLTAFNKRNTGTTAANPAALANQNVPGTNYNTESGYYNSSLPATGGMNVAGLATQGTRLMAQFSGVPAGVALYVTVNQTAGPAARLVADGPYSPIAQTTTASGVGIAPVQLTAGSGSATWEVLDADPAAIDKFQFGVAVAYLAPQAGSAAVTGVFSPLSTAGTADSTSPMPRFSSSASSAFSQCTVLPCLQTQSVVTSSYRVGDPLPAAVTIPIESTGAAINFSFSTSTSNGTTTGGYSISPAIANWLSVSASSGVTPAALTLSANPTNFPPGQYPALITLTSSGASNSPQAIAVMLNVLPPPSGTPNPFSCTLNAGVPPLIRAEGLTEGLGDYVFYCTGGTTGTVFNVTPQLTLFTNLTSKIVNATNNTTEALLLIDEPTPSQFKLGTNVFQGTLINATTMTFGSIPITAPGQQGPRILRVTNLRADAKSLGLSTTLIPTQVVGMISAPGIALSPPVLTLAYVMRAKTFDLRTAAETGAASLTFQQSGGATAGTVNYVARFSESFSTAFRKRALAAQDGVGYLYSTESMFFSTVFPTTNGLNQAGQATQGTRLMARFQNVPAGVTLHVTTTNVNSGTLSARLAATDSTGTGAYQATSQSGTATYNGSTYGVAPVALANGNGIAVWEVLASSPQAVEDARFGIVAAYSAPLAGSATVTGVLAPFNGLNTADSTSPVPRFNEVQCTQASCIGVPVAIQTVSGDQTVVAGRAASFPMQVYVSDANVNPASGAPVTFSAPTSGASGTFANGSRTIAVLTDGSGRATISGFTANMIVGDYSITASAGSVSASIRVSNVSTGYGISGHVSGPTGVTIALIAYGSTVTDASGNYSFASLTPGGAYTVTPSLAGYTFNPPSQDINGLYADQIVNFVAMANSSVTLTATPMPAAFGQPVTLKAAVAPATATGLVTFYDGANVIGTRAISAGNATLVTALLPAGAHSLRAYYAGDAADNPAYSAYVALTVSFIPAVLSITKTHSGNFTQGQTNAVYTVTVSNAAGAGPTTSIVTVNEAVPPPFTLVSMSGSGWTCPFGPHTCTRSDALAAGASYPPITVLVNVTASTPSPQVNQVSVSGGGSAAANATDSTIIVPSLKLPFDFNADGKSDILWQEPALGDLWVWFMNGTASIGAAPLNGGTDWRVPGAADFNADGMPDILWQQPVSGDLWVWFMNGTTHVGQAPLGGATDWRVVGVADINGDGKPDILWQHPVLGDLWVWYMNGTTQIGAAPLGGSTTWKVVGAADINGDGKPDILWQHPTLGDLWVWYMNGATQTGAASLGGATTWRVVGTGDFNGDGKPDILWQLPGAGDLWTWFMNGAGQTGAASLGGQTTWKAIGAR
jgi:hypothetical protein